MNNLDKAKEIFNGGDYTCVLYKDGVTYLSNARGVAPVLNFIDNQTDLKGFAAVDKVVGRAEAMLFALTGIKELYAVVLSKSAEEFLKNSDIEYSYGRLTDKIMNRRGDGLCPMEQATAGIDDPSQAYIAVKNRMNELRKEKR